MNILGISAFYHDSAAALVQDGRISAAAQEERFTRRKQDPCFPQHAVEYCLAAGGIGPADLDFVAFHEKPLLKFDRLLETYLAVAPRGLHSFCTAMPGWLRQKLRVPHELNRGLHHGYPGRPLFLEHHESHAASAFFPSPFDEAAILTCDGVGEWATAASGSGRGNRIVLTHQMRFPHSLGLLYSAFTSFAGFPVNSGESKLMGLAPLGEPRFKNLILNRLIDLKPDGSFRLDLSYFHYCHGLTMTAPRFAELFGGPPRRPETAITQREKDIAASIQVVTGEILARCARHILRTTGQRRLVLAGGVALNCVANARILEDGITDDVWIQPAAGDAGAALGAALFVWHQLLDKPRCVVAGTDRQAGSLLGPSFTDLQVRDTLDQRGASYRCFDDEDTLLDWVAGLLAAGKVVGWFQGRMEFGPRALGNRSILGDPRSPTMQATLNDKIKRRESFRPFAPSILRERTGDWFTVPAGAERPYMLLTTAVKPERRGSVPAVTHVDGSARVQTVDAGRNPRFHRLLERFHNSTGCPLVVNTSFNVRDEPIVATPADAYRCFMATELDALVVENCALLKQDQPSAPRPDSQMATIPPHCQPALCQLRQFGLALGAAGGVGGALLFFRHGRASVAAAVWAVGGAVALTGMVAPARLRSVHRGLTAIGTPIGFLVSRVALTLVHVLLVTPIGVVRRWTGGDGLGRQWERERTTYWEPRDEAPKGDRYFRQY